MFNVEIGKFIGKRFEWEVIFSKVLVFFFLRVNWEQGEQ